MGDRATLLRLMSETTSGLRSAKLAIDSPSPGANLAAIQPRLREIVRKNRAFIPTFKPADELDADSLDALRENTDLLERAANSTPTQYATFSERLDAALAELPKGLAIGGTGIVLVLILILLIAKK